MWQSVAMLFFSTGTLDDTVGDVIANGQILKDWGLHLIDVNVAMGNLVDIVAQQSKAYAAKK
jgi:hypothetical protein